METKNNKQTNLLEFALISHSIGQNRFYRMVSANGVIMAQLAKELLSAKEIVDKL